MANRRPTCKKKGCRKWVRPYTSGRPPAYCADHDPQKARTKKKPKKTTGKNTDPQRQPKNKTEEELERAAGREVYRRDGSRAALAALKAFRPQFLAVHLRDGVTPEEAAALAGIYYESQAELDELVAKARAYPDITKNTPQARAAVLSDAVMKGALRLSAGVGTMAVAQLPNALYRMVDAIEKIAGKTQQAYTHLGLVIEPYGVEDGERWDPRELLPEELRGMSPPLSSTTGSPTRPSGSGTTRSVTGNTEPSDVH